MHFPELLYFIDLVLLQSFVVNGSPDDSLLIKDLLKDYDNLSRPVEHQSYVLNLTVGVTLLQLIEVNEKLQIITSNILLKLSWSDYKLKWDPKNYGDIQDVRIPKKLLWRPDFRLYNTASEDIYRDDDGVLLYVQSGGLVAHAPPMILKSTCRMDVTWFPFDEQKCTLKFGSWTHSGRQMDILLENESADLHGYVDNGEWELLAMKATREVKHYPCCPEPYLNILYEIHIRRRTFYYFFNLIVPCALIGFLALLGFTLPPDLGEKLSLGVTVLFSLIVFLTMIAESMPANSDAVPLLGTYFNCVMFMIASSVVSTVVINLNQRATKIREVNGITKQLFLSWLPWILRMDPPLQPPPRFQVEKGSKINVNLEKVKTHDSGTRVKPLLLGDPHFISVEKEEYLGMVQQQWKFVAIVVDRVCLIVSILFTLIATTALLISSCWK